MKGAMLLPTILMLSAVVMMMGLAGLAVGVALNRGNASLRASNKALEAARAGVADAERRIISNPQWAPVCASLGSAAAYIVTVSSEATVKVCINKIGNQYTVLSQGSARLRERRLDAVITVDLATGQVKRQSINETAF